MSVILDSWLVQVRESKIQGLSRPFIRKFKDQRVEKISFGKQCPGSEKRKNLQAIWLNLQWQVIL